jgi:3',5'-cyclic AMP phosphodiesterase CpdA
MTIRNLKRLGYLALAALAVFLWMRPPVQVEENSGTLKTATLLGGPMVQLGNTDGLTSIVIAWRTVGKTAGRVDYGETSAYGQKAVSHDSTDRHAVVLRGLQPNREYHYRVSADNRSLANAVFQTGKTADRPFKFAVLGDSGSGHLSQHLVARQIEKQRVDFLLHTGDVVYLEGKDEDYAAKFYLPFKDLVARVPIFPVLGNHDLETANGQPWLDNFVLPGDERTYSFSYGNAFVVALNSYRTNINSARWLEAQLAKTDRLWRFAFCHMPPFSNHKNRRNHADAIRLWLPLFEKYKVDIVFSGHDHMYTRFKPHNGVQYIVEGLGGYSFQQLNPRAQDVVFTNNAEYGFGLTEIDGRKLVFRHITADGRVLDEFSLAK